MVQWIKEFINEYPGESVYALCMVITVIIVCLLYITPSVPHS